MVLSWKALTYELSVLSDIRQGNLLGSGEFGNVYEITSLEGSTRNLEDTTESSLENVSQIMDASQIMEASLQGQGDVESIKARMIHYPMSKNGKPRYAVKRLRPQIKENLKADAVIDLACEAQLLSRIIHPNIVRLRGTVGVPGSSRYMLILDRLDGTLNERLKDWRVRKKGAEGRRLFGKKDKLELSSLFTERLLAAFDVARALRCLHGKRILFRDLKPENVGVDNRGDFRIFDFGLARELKPKELVRSPDEYEVTGLTGSRRYMAPGEFECKRWINGTQSILLEKISPFLFPLDIAENVLCKNYGFSSDVYSFGIMFWQMFALKTPFDKFDHAKHMDLVVNKGKRPSPIKSILSPTLHQMMEKCWSENTKQRPTFDTICDTLQDELIRIESGNDSQQVLDRSNYLLDRSTKSTSESEIPRLFS